MDRTRFEKEFFSITEKLCFEVDENGSYSYDSFNYQLFQNADEFKSEIIENITKLSEAEREFYLNRILKRLNNVLERFETLDEKTEKTYPLGIKANIMGNSPLKDFIIEPEEIQMYFSMIGRYKKEMLDFIHNLQPKQKKLQMTKIISKAELLEIFKKVYEIPEFVNELNDYERAEILKQAEKNIKDSEAHIYRLFNETPNLIEMITQKALEKGYSREHLFDFILDEDPQRKQALTVIRIINNNGGKQIEKQELETIKPEIKPLFKPEAIETIFELLKDFFSKENQTELNKILQNGGDASTHLIFLDNGNRLADAFKKLYKADYITGCQQNELEAWIQRNFCYRNRGEIKDFTPRYLNDMISTNKPPSKKPILRIANDKTTGKNLIVKA